MEVGQTSSHLQRGRKGGGGGGRGGGRRKRRRRKGSGGGERGERIRKMEEELLTIVKGNIVV